MSERPKLGERGSFTDLAFDSGVIWAEDRLIQWLYENGVVRDSMIGDGWVVVYTENGPIDLKREKLRSAKNG